MKLWNVLLIFLVILLGIVSVTLFKEYSGGEIGSVNNQDEDEVVDNGDSLETNNVATESKTFLVCIGMSNANQECDFWIDLANGNLKNSLNPKLTIVNCAVGGHAIEKWNDETYDDILWDECNKELNSLGLESDDAVYVWHKAAKQFLNKEETQVLLSSDEAYDELLNELDIFSERIKEEMPFVDTVFISGRSYGGFTTNPQRGEPYSYETNLAISEWVSINSNVDGISYKKGPYFWGPDCSTGEENGLCYERSDYQEDGVHPATGGKQKIVQIINEFFMNYEWYKA